jgi:thiol-disulfide isomerase/thioredoxin
MYTNRILFGIFFLFGFICCTQENRPLTLNIGDPAPSIKVSRWLKGEPVNVFNKGTVYVVEFWATWCNPCIAAIPHLSALSGKYEGKLIILGINVKEKKSTSIDSIKNFIDRLSNQISYNIGVDDNDFMNTNWIKTSGEEESGIPLSFVVNTEGKLAWIGHSSQLDEVLPKVINNTWNLQEAIEKRKFYKYLKRIDDSARVVLNQFVKNSNDANDMGRPDSALLVINEIIGKEPGLKFAPFIAFHTFSSLLRTDQHKAYDYGKAMLTAFTYEEPDCYAIIDPIKRYSNKLHLSKEIYLLGAEAYQTRIQQIIYPKLIDLFKLYHEMAQWYWYAGEKSKAIESEKIAIKTLKSTGNFSDKTLNEYQDRLVQYEK